MDQEESLQIDAGILHYVHNRSLILRSIFGLLLCQKEMLNQFHRYEVSSHTMMLLRNGFNITSRARDRTNPMNPLEHPREVIFEVMLAVCLRSIVMTSVDDFR